MNTLDYTVVIAVSCIFIYFIILIVLGLWSETHFSPFATNLERWVNKEFDAIRQFWFWFLNCYWFIRCIFQRHWWQNRKVIPNYGMSWEGKEKNYLTRYAMSK